MSFTVFPEQGDSNTEQALTMALGEDGDKYVINHADNGLDVSAGTGLAVDIDEGEAWIHGYHVIESADQSDAVTCTASATGYVCLKLTLASGKVSATGYTYESSLPTDSATAKYLVLSMVTCDGSSVTTLVDMRRFYAPSGFVPLMERDDNTEGWAHTGTNGALDVSGAGTALVCTPLVWGAKRYLYLYVQATAGTGTATAKKGGSGGTTIASASISTTTSLVVRIDLNDMSTGFAVWSIEISSPSSLEIMVASALTNEPTIDGITVTDYYRAT